MHPNPIFRNAPTARNIDLVRERGFGMLAINGADGPLTSNIPALLSEDGSKLDFHLVRSNPISAALKTATDAVFLVNGPDGYISPDWYGLDDQVPTWNYIAVRLTGAAKLLPDRDLKSVLDRLSAHFEERLHPKPPWTTDKMSSDTLTRMMNSIVPARMIVDQIDATWKLNQNKPAEARLAAADGTEKSRIGASPDQLAALMRTAKV